MKIAKAPVNLSKYDECPCHVRMIDGVPILFTDRGEVVAGQIECAVFGAVNEMVRAHVELYVTDGDG